MSLTGIREMSTIQTPPEERHPVLTYVGPYDDRQVAAAIHRELIRDGQVFFIHNRVESIDRVAGRLRDLVPEARVAVAQKNRDLTQRNRYPDLTVGVSPSQMGSRITTWGVMVEMNIPLQQASRRSQERESEAMVSAARSRAESLSQQLLGELAVNLAGLEVARRTEALVETQLLPQSELGLRSALAAYENGKAEFSMEFAKYQAVPRVVQEELIKKYADRRARD